MKITVHLDGVDPETDAQSDEVAEVLHELARTLHGLGFGPLYSMPGVTVS
jgi:hypothetical protein